MVAGDRSSLRGRAAGVLRRPPAALGEESGASPEPTASVCAMPNLNEKWEQNGTNKKHQKNKRNTCSMQCAFADMHFTCRPVANALPPSIQLHPEAPPSAPAGALHGPSAQLLPAAAWPAAPRIVTEGL